MQGKLTLKIVAILFIVSCWLLAVRGLNSGFNFWSQAEESETLGMTLDEARARIAKHDNMDQIPKEIWKQILDPAQYQVMWEKDTDTPFSGSLDTEVGAGTYVSAGCKLPVFSSAAKFDAKDGWLSFSKALDNNNVVLRQDKSWGVTRTDAYSRCGEYLGQIYEDESGSGALRYRINSLALHFVPDDAPASDSPSGNTVSQH